MKSDEVRKSHDFKTHEIRVGISPVPFWATLGGFEDRERKGVLEEIYGDKEGKSRVFPLLSISYNHYLKNWFSLNTRLSYSGRYNYIYTGADSHVDHLEINPVINIMEVAQFTYMRKEKVRLYSGVGLGISTLYGSLIPAIQFTFFGVSFGKKVFGFVETGGGTEYFSVHGGIGYRF